MGEMSFFDRQARSAHIRVSVASIRPLKQMRILYNRRRLNIPLSLSISSACHHQPGSPVPQAEYGYCQLKPVHVRQRTHPLLPSPGWREKRKGRKEKTIIFFVLCFRPERRDLCVSRSPGQRTEPHKKSSNYFLCDLRVISSYLDKRYLTAPRRSAGRRGTCSRRGRRRW